MKKVAAGFLAGVMAAMTVTAYADEIGSAIGRTVEGTLPLKINGQKASKNVIVVDGTSYLPVRAAGELFGYKVDFAEGEVRLDNKPGGTPAGANTGTSAGTGQGGAADAGTVLYSVKTSLFSLSSAKGSLMERDGEQYLSALVFERYLSNDGTTVTVRLPNRTQVEFEYKGEYKAGVKGYNEDGLFVSLSALGLKATVNGTNLSLVQK